MSYQRHVKGLLKSHLFGYELVLLARHHFHLDDSLDTRLGRQGCQRYNSTEVDTTMVCVLLAVGMVKQKTKFNLPEVRDLSN